MIQSKTLDMELDSFLHVLLIFISLICLQAIDEEILPLLQPFGQDKNPT